MLKKKTGDEAKNARAASAASGGAASAGDKPRSELAQLEKDDLLTRLVDHLVGEEADVRRDKALANQCRRVFGAMGPAWDEAIDVLAARSEKQIRSLLASGEIEQARTVALELERALHSYASKVRARPSTGAKKDGKAEWRGRVVDLVRRKDRLKESVLKESQFHPRINAKTEEEKLRFTYPYLAAFRVYARDQTFDRGELLLHPLFGMGRIVDMPERGQMVVQFSLKVGAKILAFQPRPYV